jgi:hypothetical protein
MNEKSRTQKDRELHSTAAPISDLKPPIPLEIVKKLFSVAPSIRRVHADLFLKIGSVAELRDDNVFYTGLTRLLNGDDEDFRVNRPGTAGGSNS